jgi:hypothetical protein
MARYGYPDSKQLGNSGEKEAMNFRKYLDRLRPKTKLKASTKLSQKDPVIESYRMRIESALEDLKRQTNSNSEALKDHHE